MFISCSGCWLSSPDQITSVGEQNVCLMLHIRECGQVWPQTSFKMFFLFPLCHEERVTFVLLQTPRAVSFCVHWIFVFTRLPSAASVQHPVGVQSADQSADQREECTQLCKSLPSCRAQLVLVPAVRGNSVLLLGLQNI